MRQHFKGERKINYMNIITKSVEKMNHYFGLQEGNEKATANDFIIFYGMLATGLIGTVYFTIKIITF